MSGLITIKLDFVQTMALASVLYWVGITICRKVKFLIKYNIPPIIVGGLIFAVVRAALASKIVFRFDITLMRPFMDAFFATIGLGASVAMLKRGGGRGIRLLAAAALLLLIQNGAALLVGKACGFELVYALIAGSPTMTGGHGTGLAFAHEIERIFGPGGLMDIAIACATFGIIAGSLFGGPVAEFLIKKHSLASELPASEYRKELVPDVFRFGDTFEEITAHRILMTIFQVSFCVSVGMIVSEVLLSFGIVMPSYAIALFVGAVIRNIGDHVHVMRVVPRAVNLISGACMSFFLAFALLSFDLLEIAGVLPAILAVLVIQTIIMILFAVFVTYPLVGRDYNGALIASGHVGFGLGATPNAIANMEAVAAKYGVDPTAFFAVAAVGGFFIDMINVLVLNLIIGAFL